MGHQQLLVIIIGIVAVSIAIASGLSVFTTHSVEVNKVSISNDLLALGRYAYGYRLKAAPLGGGGGIYTGFAISDRLQRNANAIYTAEVMPSHIIFTATSVLGYGKIAAVLDTSGTLGNFSYTGNFR